MKKQHITINIHSLVEKIEINTMEDSPESKVNQFELMENEISSALLRAVSNVEFPVPTSELSKDEHHTIYPQKEKTPFLNEQSEKKDLGQLLNEIYDMILSQPREQFLLSLSEIRQLHRIIAMLPSEGANSEGDLPTSFAYAETQLSKCISECLRDDPAQIVNTDEVLKLIQDCRVFQSLPERKQSVSLERVHGILQDNFPDSSLTLLFNILLAGFYDSQTKVITF